MPRFRVTSDPQRVRDGSRLQSLAGVQGAREAPMRWRCQAQERRWGLSGSRPELGHLGEDRTSLAPNQQEGPLGKGRGPSWLAPAPGGPSRAQSPHLQPSTRYPAQGCPKPGPPCVDKLSFFSPRSRPSGVGTGRPANTAPLNAFLPPAPSAEPAVGRQPCHLAVPSQRSGGSTNWHLLSVKIQLIPEDRLNISEF